jgi:site-specific DNA-methyltransferase (adenine-specific)
VAKDVEENWQDVKTPEWVAKEMVRCIPDLKTRSRFLVLFNIELLDALVKEGVPVNKITFGSDSALEQAMAEGLYKKLKTIPIGRTFDEMKKALEGKAGQYDVVLSNPPYQIKDGGFGVSARPIYHEIVIYIIDSLKPQYVCMITPSRWMAGGKGLDDYRAKMLADKRIRLIQDFPGNTSVFETVSIGGGVSYFFWDRDRDPKEVLCSFNGIDRDIGEFDVLVRDNTSVQILKKVLAKHTGKTFCDKLVISRKPFGLATNFKEWQPAGTPGSVKCYCAKKDGFEKWVDANIVNDPHGVQGKWKVLTLPVTYEGSSFSGGKRQIFSKIFIAEKASVCIETYIVTGSFNTKKEADNYLEYMKTKFYRFMLSLRVISQHISKGCFAWVPDLGSYANLVTDEDLYAHFNLTKKEIEHINSTIK